MHVGLVKERVCGLFSKRSFRVVCFLDRNCICQSLENTLFNDFKKNLHLWDVICLMTAF